MPEISFEPSTDALDGGVPASPSLRTLKEEFFAVAFRKTFYESLDQLQADLDRYLEFYNRERAHQGYRTQGRTPYQAFLDGVKQMPEKTLMEETNNLPQERVA